MRIRAAISFYFLTNQRLQRVCSVTWKTGHPISVLSTACFVSLLRPLRGLIVGSARKPASTTLRLDEWQGRDRTPLDNLFEAQRFVISRTTIGFRWFNHVTKVGARTWPQPLSSFIYSISLQVFHLSLIPIQAQTPHLHQYSLGRKAQYQMKSLFDQVATLTSQSSDTAQSRLREHPLGSGSC